MYDLAAAVAAATTTIQSGLTLIDTATVVGALVAASVVGTLLLSFAGKGIRLAKRMAR